MGLAEAIAGISGDIGEDLFGQFAPMPREIARLMNFAPISSIAFQERARVVTRRSWSASPGVKPAMAIAISITCS